MQSGLLRAWLEETYIWWTTYNPCSAAQATQTVVQQTATAATSAATAAASSAASAAATAAASAAAPPPVPTTPTAPPPTTSTSSSSSSSSSTSSTTETKSETTTETKTETKSESKTETKSEEKKEESKTESKEEKKEESKEESKEEKKEDKKEEKKEEKKEDKKKQQSPNPVLIAANVMAMQNLDGTFNQVTAFGLSQSSLTGETSYGANIMIWSNLKQFSLALSKTTILFNYDRKIPLKVKGIEYGSYYGKGSINKITGVNATLMLMFTTKVVSIGVNEVFLLKKGLVAGYAMGNTFIIMDKDLMVSPALTIFTTKPFPFKRYTISPMVATSFSPISYTTQTNSFGFNKYFTYIIGSNFDFSLTKRFKANLGGNLIGNTNADVPITYGITIGSKLQF